MMSIRETQEESCEQMDAQLSSFVAQQLQLGERLQLLELVLDQDTRGSWVATKQTTARCAQATNLASMSMLTIYLSISISPGPSPGTATVVSGPRAPQPPPSGLVDSCEV